LVDTWHPLGAEGLSRNEMASRIEGILRPMRCPWHDGTGHLVKHGWYPTTWEVYVTYCPMFKRRVWSQVYWGCWRRSG
jgi:hypothetical protein